jgi:hypothetical protein
VKVNCKYYRYNKFTDFHYCAKDIDSPDDCCANCEDYVTEDNSEN